MPPRRCRTSRGLCPPPPPPSSSLPPLLSDRGAAPLPRLPRISASAHLPAPPSAALSVAHVPLVLPQGIWTALQQAEIILADARQVRQERKFEPAMPEMKAESSPVIFASLLPPPSSLSLSVSPCLSLSLSLSYSLCLSLSLTLSLSLPLCPLSLSTSLGSPRDVDPRATAALAVVRARRWLSRTRTTRNC